MKMRIIAEEKNSKEYLYTPAYAMKHDLLRHWLNREEPMLQIAGFQRDLK